MKIPLTLAHLPAPLMQLIRYGIVGVSQNAVGYGLYLLLTYMGLDPKLVVGVSYPIAMLVSFMGNKKYTFHHTGSTSRAGLRFIIAHACGYTINLALLYWCVDVYGMPHQLVQLAAIFIVAAFLFITLRLFVFKNTTTTE